MLRKQEKLPLEEESVQLQEKVLDKILFQIQLPPIGDLLPFSVKQQVSVLTAGFLLVVKQQVSVLTAWVPLCETTGSVLTAWVPFSVK